MSTKVLFAPLNYGDIRQTGVEDAFRQTGAELQTFDYFYHYGKSNNDAKPVREKLLGIVMGFKPDLVHLQIQHTDIIDGKTVQKIKSILPNTKIVNWTGDVRNYIPKTYRDIARYADYNLISSTGQLDMFRNSISKDVQYWQIGYNPKLYFPALKRPQRFKYDVSFIGNDNAKEGYPGRHDRGLACKLLRKAFGRRFGLFGSNWPRTFKSRGSLNQKRLAEIYHQSYCVLSVSHYNNLSHYFSDRLLMCLACGRPTISLKYPKWESYFANNCDLVIADSVEDIESKVRYLLNNPDLAEYIGESGALRVQNEHTYLSRVNELFDIIGLSLH
jgi:spore maturation protein CgeB